MASSDDLKIKVNLDTQKAEEGAKKTGSAFEAALGKADEKAKALSSSLGGGISGILQGFQLGGPVGGALAAAGQAVQAALPNSVEYGKTLVKEGAGALLDVGTLGLVGGLEDAAQGALQALEVAKAVVGERAAAGVQTSDEEIIALMRLVAENTKRMAEAQRHVRDLWLTGDIVDVGSPQRAKRLGGPDGG